LIYLFENSNRLGSVGRAGDRISSDYQLLIDIRAFQIDATNGVAVIEVSAKLMNDRNGRIIDSAIFGERTPISGTTAVLAAKALEEALSALLVQVVQWVVKKV
jgi:cholesterol transport system auxiliary component